MGPTDKPGLVAHWRGFCPICAKETNFEARQTWFRDHLICTSCPGGSIPRERALMHVLGEIAPNWRHLRIHESSPIGRGPSAVFARDCPGYIPTQYFPDIALGAVSNGVRCENLEHQTFADRSFEIVVTQDVMEHIFDPARAYQEIWRTLQPGGVYIHTTPIYKELVTTETRASCNEDGSINYHFDPEYHGSPVDDKGSLVTYHYGYDLADLIAKWTPFDVEIRRFNRRGLGIVAEMTEVIVCYK